MSERLEQTPEQPQIPGIYTIANMPLEYSSHPNGKKEVRLIFGPLKGVVQGFMQNDIDVNLEAVAALARFGGLEQVGINIVDEEDQTGFSLSPAGVGGAATAEHAAVTRAVVELTDLAPIENGEVVHAGRWGKGSINIRKQDVEEILRKNGARDNEAVGKFLNKKIYQGVLKLAHENIRSITPHDWKVFLASQAFILGWTLIPIPIVALGYATDPTISKIIPPVTLQEEVGRFLFTETLWTTLGIITAKANRRRVYRYSEGGMLDPEFARRSLLFLYRQLSHSQRFRNKHPLVAGKTPKNTIN